MNAAFKILIFLFSPALLSTGCRAAWKTIRQGTYNGLPYEVQERVQSGAFSSTNSIDWRIRLGNLKPVPVDAVTTDWGPPYSTDIYGTDAYLFISTKDTAYSNVPFTPGTTGVAHTMLYVPSSVLDEAQFEQFYTFMKTVWPSVSATLAGHTLRDFPHLIGLVYGRQDKYTKTFKGRHDGKAMLLRMENDGRVRLMDDDRVRNESYSGLAAMVQMPGKRLLLDTARASGGLSMEELRSFRDAGGLPVGNFFSIELRNGATDKVQADATAAMLGHKWHLVQQAENDPAMRNGYLWFKQGGILETIENGVRQQGDWSYDATTSTITTLTDSSRVVYTLLSVNDQKLLLVQPGDSGNANLVLQRAD